LYSAFRACSAIVLRSNRHSKLTVATMFLYKRVNTWSRNMGGGEVRGTTHWRVGTNPSTAVISGTLIGVFLSVCDWSCCSVLSTEPEAWEGRASPDMMCVTSIRDGMRDLRERRREGSMDQGV
jgi:hypothetical protein